MGGLAWYMVQYSHVIVIGVNLKKLYCEEMMLEGTTYKSLAMSHRHMGCTCHGIAQESEAESQGSERHATINPLAVHSIPTSKRRCDWRRKKTARSRSSRIMSATP